MAETIGNQKTNQPKGPQVHKGEVYHSDMAEAILGVRSFLTLRDTKQVLWYDHSAGIYRFNGETAIEEFTQHWLDGLGLSSKATRNFMNQVIGYIQRDTYINREELNANSNILVIKNGVLDLNTGKVSEHSKDYKSTIAIPATYSANAKCPRIDRFISEIVEKQDIPLMYEIPAWCIVPNSRIQRLVLLVGEGANGKSTYLEMLRQFLGKDNCTAHSMQSLTTNRFSVAGLFGKLANINADLPSSALRQTAPLKMLSGGDSIESEKKFKDSFNFVNTAKLIFSANQPPEITEDTLAIWRRFVVVDFPFQFMDKADDKDLLAKITTETELSGYLNKVLDGLGRLKKNGDFSYFRSIEDTRSKYLLISNPTGTFIEDYCEFDVWATITKKELHTCFMKFCEEKKLPSLSIKAFGHKIKRTYNLAEERDSWRGIKLGDKGIKLRVSGWAEGMEE